MPPKKTTAKKTTAKKTTAKKTTRRAGGSAQGGRGGTTRADQTTKASTAKKGQSYAKLKNNYLSLKTGAAKQKFLKEHPGFAKNFSKDPAAPGSGVLLSKGKTLEDLRDVVGSAGYVDPRYGDLPVELVRRLQGNGIGPDEYEAMVKAGQFTGAYDGGALVAGTGLRTGDPLNWWLSNLHIPGVKELGPPPATAAGQGQMTGDQEAWNKAFFALNQRDEYGKSTNGFVSPGAVSGQPAPWQKVGAGTGAKPEGGVPGSSSEPGTFGAAKVYATQGGTSAVDMASADGPGGGGGGGGSGGGGSGSGGSGAAGAGGGGTGQGQSFQQLWKKYQALSPGQKKAFRQSHPKFAQALKGGKKGAVGEPATVGGGGGGTGGGGGGGAGGGAEEGPSGGTGPDEPEEEDPDAPKGPGQQEVPGAQSEEGLSLIATLSEYLGRFFSAADVEDLINSIVKPALNQGLNDYEIQQKLLGSNTFKTYFPEYWERIENGYKAASPEEILVYRDQVKNLTKFILGDDADNATIGKALANNWSIQEVEHRLNTEKTVRLHGGDVQSIVFERLGIKMNDDDLRDLFDTTKNTGELDDVVRFALYAGRPTVLGFGRRSAEEVRLMEQLGLSQEESFGRFEAAAARRAAFEKFASIEADLTGTGKEYLNDTTEADIVKGFVLQDPETLARLGQTVAKEFARNRKGGGAAFQGSRAVGLSRIPTRT